MDFMVGFLLRFAFHRRANQRTAISGTNKQAGWRFHILRSLHLSEFRGD
jgi:hypothetical protein